MECKTEQELDLEPNWKTAVLCCNCNSEIETDEGINIDDDIYCDECVSYCDNCNSYHETDNITYMENLNKSVCESCYGEYIVCYDCDDYALRDNNSHCINDEYICDTCYSDNYFYCERCETSYHNDNYGGDSECENCYSDSDRDSDTNSQYIHAYDYRPRLQFYGKGLKMGVEIEIDKGECHSDLADELYNMSDNEQKFYLKTDGSLDNGIEIVSHPMSLEYHSKFEWDNIFRKCLDYGFRSHNTKTCGIHIHISKSFLSQSETIKLALFINTNKPIMEKIARRTSSGYSEYKAIHKGQAKYSASNPDTRYEAINYNNVQTIEFRFFRGTLKHETFMACLQFINSTCYFIKTVNTNQVYDYDSYMTKYMNGKAFRLYCQYLRENKKTYSILINYLKQKGVYICV